MAAIAPPWLRAADQVQVALVNSINASVLSLTVSTADASRLVAAALPWATPGYGYILRFTGTAPGDTGEFVYATNVNTGTGVITLGTLSPPAGVPPGRAATLATQYPANVHPSGALLELRYTAEQVVQLQNAVDLHDHTGTQGNGAVLSSASLPATISNKILDNSNTMAIKDTNFSVQDNADPNRVMRFELGGVASGNTRVMTVPDADGTLTIQGNVTTGTGTTLVKAGGPTITNPVIAATEFTNAQHAHAAANSGGAVNHATLTNSGGYTHANIDTHMNALAAHGATDVMGTTNVQNVQNKTLDDTNSVTVKDSNFTLENAAVASRIAKFNLAGISAGFTRTMTVPDISGTMTVMGNATTGTGNIVLATSPTIATPTLGSPVIGDFSSANHNHSNPANGNTVDHSLLTSKGTTTHAALDVHVGAGSGVHVLAVNSSFLGNRNGAGEAILRGRSSATTAGSAYGSGPVMYKSTTSVTFAVAFTGIPIVVATPSSGGPGAPPFFARVESVATNAFTLMLGSPQSGVVDGQAGDWMAIGIPSG